jgi:transcriptional regulator with XRE-family HTH domain
MDIKKVRQSLGLNGRELAALLGECHTTPMRIEKSTEHRPMTNMLYWLLLKQGVQSLSTLLDYWLYHPPKDAIQLGILMRLARRYKGQEYSAWISGMQAVHPELFGIVTEEAA